MLCTGGQKRRRGLHFVLYKAGGVDQFSLQRANSARANRGRERRGQGGSGAEVRWMYGLVGTVLYCAVLSFPYPESGAAAAGYWLSFLAIGGGLALFLLGFQKK